MNGRMGSTAVLFLLIFTPTTGWAQSEIVRIEEDWELVVANPDEQLDAPQVTVSMAPFSQLPALHLQINLNYALKPDFASGGIQVRIQNDDETLAHLHRKSGVQLSRQAEAITWTSTVQKVQKGYVFGIETGNGLSWGNFGGESYLLSFGGSLATGSLNGYLPERSLENSGTTYAGNRVTSLRLKKFRLFNSDGQVAEFSIDAQVQ